MLDIRSGFSIPNWVSAKKSNMADVVVIKNLDSIAKLLASRLAWKNHKIALFQRTFYRFLKHFEGYETIIIPLLSFKVQNTASSIYINLKKRLFLLTCFNIKIIDYTCIHHCP